MYGRTTRLLLLTVLGLAFFLYLAQPWHTRSKHKFDVSAYTDSTKGALDALKCSIDPDDPACSTSKVSSEGSKSIEEPDSVASDRPGRLSYPNGFKQFDTSSPNSPYQQDTYDATDSGETSKSILADQEATYLQRLQAWSPYNVKYNSESHNPVIWQTYKEEPSTVSIPYASWMAKNKPKWSRTFVGQDETSSAIERMSRDVEFLNETYHALPARILQMDLLRYVTLFKNGGVYADIDTHCYSAIENWYSSCYTDSPPVSHGERVRASQPGLVVGVEFDLQGDSDFTDIDGRQVALANYVFAANKGHPVLAKIISDIVTETLNSSSSSLKRFNVSDSSRVYEWTGRKAWTDTIIAHIQSTVQGFKERDLLGLKKAKVFDDICVLPIRAFGSGQSKYKNSPDTESEGVMVKHFNMHLWGN